MGNQALKVFLMFSIAALFATFSNAVGLTLVAIARGGPHGEFPQTVQFISVAIGFSLFAIIAPRIWRKLM